jgi:acetyl-CoA hydrolase
VDLSQFIRPGDGVLWGQACAEPQTLVEALVAQRDAFSGASVFLGINYSGIVKPEHADHLRISSYCGIGHNRALCDAGVLAVHAVPYSRLGPMIRSGEIRSDVVLAQVSPPNARGEYSLGLAADYLVPALETARTVIGEVNDRVPWTRTEKLLRKEDFALLAESSRPPAAPPPARLGDLELAIARHAAAFVPDGATLEFGIGALPEAVCAGLAGRKSLKVRSGAIGDGVARLMKQGVVTGADCAMLIGTREIFDFARDNPAIRLRSCEYTHGPDVLSKIEKFVAINSAVEVDLSGQVNSEMLGASYVGAVGGAPDFVRAANRSPGGASILVVPASRIVARLSAPFTLPREEAGVVVSERGAADLRGCDLAARARRLLAIAAFEARATPAGNRN